MRSKVSILRCANYQPPLLQAKVRQAVELLGGIGAFIKPGSRVLVKPNLLMAKEPEYGIDTHPEVLRAVIKLLKEVNCRIIVGDGPSVWGNQIEDVEEVYRLSGVEKVCREESVELVKFDKKRWRGKFPMTSWLDECEYLVNLPKLKTHDFTLITAAVKNLFGLVSGTYKTELHKDYFKAEDFASIMVDIFEQAKPSLSIIDAVVAMEGDGPATSGKLRNLGLLFAGADCVALDSIVSLVMGIRPHDVLSTKEAEKRGLGIADVNSIEILGERLADVTGEPFLLPTTSFAKKLPPALVNIGKRLIKYLPYVKRENCIRCSACVQACPTKAVSLRGKRIVFDYRKCISCFCCQEACPASAIKVKKSVLAKLIGL